VSKARIEAVRKLKEVEAEMKRQVGTARFPLFASEPLFQHVSDPIPDEKQYDITFVLKTSTWLRSFSSLSEPFLSVLDTAA